MSPFAASRERQEPEGVSWISFRQSILRGVSVFAFFKDGGIRVPFFRISLGMLPKGGRMKEHGGCT